MTAGYSAAIVSICGSRNQHLSGCMIMFVNLVNFAPAECILSLRCKTGLHNWASLTCLTQGSTPCLALRPRTSSSVELRITPICLSDIPACLLMTSISRSKSSLKRTKLTDELKRTVVLCEEDRRVATKHVHSFSNVNSRGMTTRTFSGRGASR